MAAAYATRNDAFTPPWELHLRGAELLVVVDGAKGRRIALADVAEVRLEFAAPRFSITPGQAAVFYAGEVVLGGGLIAPSDR